MRLEKIKKEIEDAGYRQLSGKVSDCEIIDNYICALSKGGKEMHWTGKSEYKACKKAYKYMEEQNGSN